jgi:hypothetical protein
MALFRDFIGYAGQIADGIADIRQAGSGRDFAGLSQRHDSNSNRSGLLDAGKRFLTTGDTEVDRGNLSSVFLCGPLVSDYSGRSICAFCSLSE